MARYRRRYHTTLSVAALSLSKCPAIIDYCPRLLGVYLWLRIKLGLTPAGFTTRLGFVPGNEIRRTP